MDRVVRVFIGGTYDYNLFEVNGEYTTWQRISYDGPELQEYGEELSIETWDLHLHEGIPFFQLRGYNGSEPGEKSICESEGGYIKKVYDMGRCSDYVPVSMYKAGD